MIYDEITNTINKYTSLFSRAQFQHFIYSENLIIYLRLDTDLLIFS